MRERGRERSREGELPLRFFTLLLLVLHIPFEYGLVLRPTTPSTIPAACRDHTHSLSSRVSFALCPSSLDLVKRCESTRSRLPCLLPSARARVLPSSTMYSELPPAQRSRLLRPLLALVLSSTWRARARTSHGGRLARWRADVWDSCSG